MYCGSIRADQGEGGINESLVGGELSFPGLQLDPILFFCGEQDLQKLLTIIPGGLMEEMDQPTGVFRNGGEGGISNYRGH